MEIKIDKKKCCWKNGKCASCSCGGACVEACPVGALTRGKFSVTVDKKKCIQCGACVPSCKRGALSLV